MRDGPADTEWSSAEISGSVGGTRRGSVTAESEVANLLRAVCEECGLVYGEAFTASKSDKTSMLLSSARYCAGPAQEEFYQASMQLTYHEGVGIAGRVYQRRRMEWHADCATLPADKFVRKQIAVPAGLHGVVALPFTVTRTLFVLCFFAPKPVENKHVMTVVGLTTNILQRLRIARHPKRFEASSKPASPSPSPGYDSPPHHWQGPSSCGSSACGSVTGSDAGDPVDAEGVGLRKSNSSGSLGSLLLIAQAHATSLRTVPSLQSLKKSASHNNVSLLQQSFGNLYNPRGSRSRSGSFRLSFRMESPVNSTMSDSGWAGRGASGDTTASSQIGPESFTESASDPNDVEESDWEFNGCLTHEPLTEGDVRISRTSSAISRTPSAVMVGAGTA